MRRIPLLKVRLRFSLRGVLLLFIPIGVLAALARWVFFPPPLDVRIDATPFSLVNYDDGTGRLGRGAVVCVTNYSDSTVWFLGSSRAPVHKLRELADGQWGSYISGLTGAVGHQWSAFDPPWTALPSMESITFVASPVLERATVMRVALGFTTDRLNSLA